MNNTLIASCSLLSILFLSSCSPSSLANDISFYSKYEASFCYYGKETKIFDKLNNYYDLTKSNIPDINNKFVGFAIDVNNKRDELSLDFLSKIYSSFSWNSYTYVMFFNFDSNLSLLRESSFAREMSKFTNVDGDMLMFSNGGKSDFRFLHLDTYSYGDITGKEFTVEDYLEFSFGSYVSKIKKEMLAQ